MGLKVFVNEDTHQFMNLVTPGVEAIVDVEEEDLAIVRFCAIGGDPVSTHREGVSVLIAWARCARKRSRKDVQSRSH